MDSVWLKVKFNGFDGSVDTNLEDIEFCIKKEDDFVKAVDIIKERLLKLKEYYIEYGDRVKFIDECIDSLKYRHNIINSWHFVEDYGREFELDIVGYVEMGFERKCIRLTSEKILNILNKN